MAWNILVDNCPYDPAGEFYKALCRVGSQADVDLFEDMARNYQLAVREIEQFLLDLAAAQEALVMCKADRDRWKANHADLARHAVFRQRHDLPVDRLDAKLAAAEAENTALREALEQIIDRSNNGERGTSKVDDMRILALAAVVKEPKP